LSRIARTSPLLPAWHAAWSQLGPKATEEERLLVCQAVLNRQFRLHPHRGISYLATPHAIRSITDLVRLALEDNRE
jgi:hypothetical protein